MKNSTFSEICFGLVAFLWLFSCAPDTDFEVPESTTVPEVALAVNTDLDAVLGAFFQNKENIDVVTFEQDLILETFVVSSDEAGNFYKELIVQDAPIAPTAGIAVQINQSAYYSTYDFGRKVYIKLQGLSIGELNGVVVLGIANGKQIEQIPQGRISDYIIRSSEVAEIQPLPVKALEFDDRMENLYVELENVQFADFLIDSDNPFTFASEDNDEFDGERIVESCNGDFDFILSTSTYADFKGFKLSAGSGSLKGILTRDFYDDFFTIYLNFPKDINFKDDSRCDPEILDCGLAENIGEIILFQDDFQEESNNKPIEENGWTNFVQEGSEAWEGFEASGENESLGRSARIQLAGSGDYRTVSWLISPEIDFGQHQGEVLQFKSSTSFANNSVLEVLISTDWDGITENFKNATWKILSSGYIAQREDFFGDWIPSGKVDLSCIEGKGHIAFRYTGSDQSNYDGIYELDDVLILAEE